MSRTRLPLRLPALLILLVLAVMFSYTPPAAGQAPVNDSPPAAQPPVVAAAVQPYELPPPDNASPMDQPQSATPQAESPQVLPLGRPPRPPASPQDSALPQLLAPEQVAEQDDLQLPVLNFAGLGVAQAGSILPPDPNGAIGPDHYVQMVNAVGTGARVGVFARDGSGLLYDFGLNQLWPAGDPCRERPLGDPIVLYDQLADRWLLSQFTRLPAPFHECIAISKTGRPADPNNFSAPDGWYAYTFEVHPAFLNDYPKLAVWPDAYYMTANQFSNPFTATEQFEGVGAWAFERAAMLNGQPARFVYFNVGALDLGYQSLLPATLQGRNPPPAGAPGYFAGVNQDWFGPGSDDVLHLFEFRVNWSNPGSSLFAWVKDLVVAPFDWFISGFTFYTVAQPETITRLDDLADRLMMHLNYRNFLAYESLTVNHTIDIYNAPPSTFGRAGIRWYEVRGGQVDTTLADARLYQQGTLGSPATTLNRWMGSLAMDKFGNLALGYSVSNENVFPGIRYTGRMASDPPGTLPQPELTIIDGSGSQLVYGRWGDYSAMTVDPLDDCTFWYTNEYIQNSGSFTWQTRIAAFRYPGCTTEPSPDLLLSVEPAAQSVCQAASTSFTVTTLPIDGFNQPVTLSLVGSPAGTSSVFSPNPVSAGQTSQLTLNTGPGTPGGSYTLTINGAAGSLTRTTSALLEVEDTLPGTVQLSSPVNTAVSQPLQPTFRWQSASDGLSYQFELAREADFTTLVHQAGDLLSNTYRPPVVLEQGTEYFWRVRAVNGCGPGDYSAVYRFTTLVDPASPNPVFLPILLNDSPLPFSQQIYMPVLLLNAALQP